MTRMTRDFQNNVPLIYGHGNMGAIDGSGAAAPRYTEAKLDAVADWLALDGVDDGGCDHLDTVLSVKAAEKVASPRNHNAVVGWHDNYEDPRWEHLYQRREVVSP